MHPELMGRRGSELRRERPWIDERTQPLAIWRGALFNFLKGTQSWNIKGCDFELMKGCSLVLSNLLEETEPSVVEGTQILVCEGTRASERGLWNVACSYKDAVLMTWLCVCEDLAGSFNVKSALTVGDACHWNFLEQKSMCLTLTGFDICVAN